MYVYIYIYTHTYMHIYIYIYIYISIHTTKTAYRTYNILGGGPIVILLAAIMLRCIDTCIFAYVIINVGVIINTC